MGQKLIRRALIGLGLVCLSTSNAAFAGPFEKYFQGASNAEISALTLPPQQPPQLFITNTLDRDVRRLYEDGYDVIGSSAFVGPPTEPKKSLKIAKKIKAEIVLYSSSYESTKSGAMPMLLPNNSTTTVNGNVYGSGGSGGFGGTVNTFGTKSMVVPFSVDRYNQTAVFFAKLRPENIGLGIRMGNLEPHQAQSLGTNKAIVVLYVIRNSPAFEADLLSDDIILTVAGRDISSSEKIRQVKLEFAGKTVPVEVVRGGTSKILQIAMPSINPSNAEVK